MTGFQWSHRIWNQKKMIKEGENEEKIISMGCWPQPCCSSYSVDFWREGHLKHLLLFHQISFLLISHQPILWPEGWREDWVSGTWKDKGGCRRSMEWVLIWPKVTGHLRPGLLHNVLDEAVYKRLPTVYLFTILYELRWRCGAQLAHLSVSWFS